MAGTSGCAGRERGEPGLEGQIRLAQQQLKNGQAASAQRILADARMLARDDAERVRLALLSGDCLMAMQQYAAASDEYFRARGLAEENDREATYVATMGLARSRLAEGQGRSAERHLLEALALADTAAQRDRAYLELARRSLAGADRKQAADYLARIEDQQLFGLAELRAELKPIAPTAKPAPIELPTVLAPEIIARERWGARPVRNSGNPEPMEKPWRITVHHSAEPERPPTDLAASVAQMQRFQGFHQDDRGWADIGYHYVIDGAGRIFEGREIGLQGAHAGTRELNRGNIGVCLMGDFSRLEPTAEQKKALRRLLSWLCESRRIHPRFIVGHRAGMKDIAKDTICPGARLEAFLARLIPFLPRP
ncbi:MAG: N-acetylmuramoyl-L-alanine amidase [Planctomycetes bacterium]|nr:N-acetylmuramoyl-L-alanine amidase [Planctomycetota bacterium]